MTDREAGNKGLTAFVVEKGMLGLSFGAPLHKLGIRWTTTEVHFDGVRVPVENCWLAV